MRDQGLQGDPKEFIPGYYNLGASHGHYIAAKTSLAGGGSVHQVKEVGCSAEDATGGKER